MRIFLLSVVAGLGLVAGCSSSDTPTFADGTGSHDSAGGGSSGDDGNVAAGGLDNSGAPVGGSDGSGGAATCSDA